MLLSWLVQRMISKVNTITYIHRIRMTCRCKFWANWRVDWVPQLGELRFKTYTYWLPIILQVWPYRNERYSSAYKYEGTCNEYGYTSKFLSRASFSISTAVNRIDRSVYRHCRIRWCAIEESLGTSLKKFQAFTWPLSSHHQCFWESHRTPGLWCYQSVDFIQAYFQSFH